jgi:hypothetical protein
MIKVKLYKIENEIIKSDIQERLLLKQYSDERGFGFDILNDDDNELTVQFIERIIRNQSFELPNGETSEIETVSYNKIKFVIRFNSTLALYALNPPRSMKYPFELIHTIFGEDSGLRPVEFNLKELLDIFDEKYNILVKSVSLSNIHYDAFTLAKTKIASTKNLLPYYIKTYKETSAIIDSIHMTVNDFSVEISRTGRFIVPDATLFEFMLMLEHSSSVK